MLAEGGGGPGEGIGALDGQLCGKPGAAQDSGIGPDRWCEVVLGGQVLGEGREEGVPAFVPDCRGLLLQERRGPSYSR